MRNQIQNMGFLFLALMWISMMGMAIFTIPKSVKISSPLESYSCRVPKTTNLQQVPRPRSTIKFDDSRYYVVFWNTATCNAKYMNHTWYTTDLFQGFNVYAERIWSQRSTIVSTWNKMVSEMVPGDDTNVNAFLRRIPISIDKFHKRDLTCNENHLDDMFTVDRRGFYSWYFIRICEPDVRIIDNNSILKAVLNAPFAENHGAGTSERSTVNLNTVTVPGDMSYPIIRPWISVLLHEVLHCFGLGHAIAPTYNANQLGEYAEFGNLMGTFLDNYQSGRFWTHYLNGAMSHYLGIADSVEIVKYPIPDGKWRFAGTVPIIRWSGVNDNDNEQESFWRSTRTIVIAVPTLIDTFDTLFIDATIFRIDGRGFVTFGTSGKIDSHTIYLRSHVLSASYYSYLMSMMPISSSGSNSIDLDLHTWPLNDGRYVRQTDRVITKMPVMKIRASTTDDGYIQVYVCYKRHHHDNCDAETETTEHFVQMRTMGLHSSSRWSTTV